MDWDGEVYCQSRHQDEYQHYLDELERQQLTYRCVCSRKELSDYFAAAGQSKESPVYPGVCRDKHIPQDLPNAIRIKTDTNEIGFTDQLQGSISQNLTAQQGDFILKRKDGIVAYQFAVVVDDYLQQISHVVRGCDLLQETPKQIYLQQLLGFSIPAYMHVPIIADHNGYKLSKQTLATAVDINKPEKVLFDLLVLLKQNPLEEIRGATVNELLAGAINRWNANVLEFCQTINS